MPFSQAVFISDEYGNPPGTLADGVTPPATTPTAAIALAYNGSAYDRWYANVQGTLVASGARTTAPVIPTMTNFNHAGLMLYLNVTASPANASASLAVAVQAVDPVSGALCVLAQPAAVAATGVANAVTGLYVVQAYPGLGSSSTMTKNGPPASYNAVVPRSWTASVVPATADAWNYSLAYALML